MAIDEYSLSKGQLRKLSALRKSVGDKLAEDVFAKWLKQQASKKTSSKPDPVALKIASAISHLEHDSAFKLGRYGYVIKRAQGRGTSGFSIQRVTKD